MAGIPALKLWPEKLLDSEPRCGSRSCGRMELTVVFVRFVKFWKQKTGEVGMMLCCESFKATRAATGQTPWPVKLKMSTNSPCGRRDLGDLMWIRM